MSDIAFLSMLAMFGVGIVIGRRSWPLNGRVMLLVFLSFVCFYLAAGVVKLAE